MCVKEKFINYFAFYHTLRLDELKIFLENDGWKLCPVKSTFNITQLLEFKTFIYIFNLSQDNNILENLTEHANFKTNTWIQDFINDFSSPFNIILDKSVKDDFFQTSGVSTFILKSYYLY
jgi:hypothetical protein